MSSGLLRYRSAPSNLFGDVCEDFLPVRPSSPDTETMFARFLTAPERNAHYAPPPPTTNIFSGQPHNRVEFSGQQMMYHSHHQQHQQMPNHSQSPVEVQYQAPTRTEQIKIEDGSDGNESLHSLLRQSSSPAGLFSQNGLKHQMSFSSQTASFPTSLWDDTPLSNSFTGLKRPRESELEAKLLEGLNMQSKLQVQDSVLCKMRAKRGCATHPRSIAERVRRTRISERMRKLQELVPNMDKANTSDMLDLAVEHIKDLQEQVKRLSEIRASCTCSSKRIRYSNTGV